MLKDLCHPRVMTSKKFTIPSPEEENDSHDERLIFRPGMMRNTSPTPSASRSNEQSKIESPLNEEKLQPTGEALDKGAGHSSATIETTLDIGEKRKIGPKSNCVIVSHKQRGNPLLKNIRNVNWEYGDILPDYLMGQSTCALFLSLKYHNLYPNYIYERVNAIGRRYLLQVLLVLVDVTDPNASLKELAKVAILSDFTLMCAWSNEEAGRIIDIYKLFEHKSPQLIMEKQLANINGTEGNYKCTVEALASVKSVNKTDAVSLISVFESLDSIVKATPEELATCPGLGPQKADRLFELFHRPFIRS